jgi:hypothetical protein
MSADRTKSRKAKRAAAFKLDDPAPASAKPGRLKPLRDRPMAHEAAIYHTATAWLGCAPGDAARLAAVLGSETTTIKILTAGEGQQKFDGLGLAYSASERSRRAGINSLQNRANHILMTVPAIIADAKGSDAYWLQLALQALSGLYIAVRDFNQPGVETAIELLGELGWHARAELFLKSQRYQRVKVSLG